MALPLRAKYTSSTSAAFNALTGVANTTEYITTLSAHGFVDNDIVKYTVSAGNTAVSGLTNSYNYFVTSSNTTALKLATSPGGLAINVTAGISQQGHSLTLQVFAGVQEMSNADISDVVSSVMLNEIVISNPPYTQPRITSNVNLIVPPALLLNGTIINQYPSGAIGTHPATYSTDEYYLYEANSTPQVSASATVKPVVQSVSGSGVTTIQEMTSAAIQQDIFPIVIDDLGSYGPGSYYIASTGSPPGTGTWTAKSTFSLKYANTSAVTSDSYTLYQQTALRPIGYIRPLKQTVVSGVTRLTEMSDNEIKQWVTGGLLSEYIRTTGLGIYTLIDLAINSLPAGTYANLGTVGEKTNDITDVAYNGFYSSSYTQGYTQNYTQVWTRNLAYNTPYTQTYTNSFTRVYTGLYTSMYTNTYTNVYTSNVYTRVYTVLFNSTYTGVYTTAVAFVGGYARSFTSQQFFNGFVRNNTFAGIFTGVYTGLVQYIQQSAETYTGTDVYAAYFVRPSFGGFGGGTFVSYYTGPASYMGFYSRNQYTQNYTSTYSQTFTGTYTQVWTQLYTNVAVEPYTQVYTNVFSTAYTQLYTGQYTAVYTRVYTQLYTRAYTGIYTGLTVQAAISTSTYTFFLRVA
jgi:hypothetical protein